MLDETETLRPAARSSMRVLMVAVPALFLMAIALVIGILQMRGANFTSPAPEAAGRPPESADPLESCFHTMPLPFGMKARNECGAACYGPNVEREICERGCDRLVVSEFARTPAVESPDPVEVAKLIAQDCGKAAAQAAKSQPADSWRSAARAALDLYNAEASRVDFYAREGLLERYLRLEAAAKSLELPADGTESEVTLARELQLAFCERMSLVATQLAVSRVAESGDRVSEKFYRALEQALLDENSSQAIVLTERRMGALPG